MLKKDQSKEKNLSKEELEKIKEESKISREDMKEVAGGGAFGDVPKVQEHDYSSDVQNRT